MSLTIENRDRAIVQGILAEHLAGKEVWAFGSRVTGRARQYSDLDLAVVSPEMMPTSQRLAVQEAFCESLLPFKVDIVELAKVSPIFRQIVERDHVVLQPGETRAS